MWLESHKKVPACRIRAFLATGTAVAGCAGVMRTAAPAYAKATVELMVHPRIVRAGHLVRVSADGGDDATGATVKVCVDEQVGWFRDHRVWVTLRGSGKTNPFETVRFTFRPVRPGHIHLRAQLLEQAPTGNGWQVKSWTPITAIRVLSLSSDDAGGQP